MNDFSTFFRYASDAEKEKLLTQCAQETRAELESKYPEAYQDRGDE